MSESRVGVDAFVADFEVVVILGIGVGVIDVFKEIGINGEVAYIDIPIANGVPVGGK